MPEGSGRGPRVKADETPEEREARWTAEHERETRGVEVVRSEGDALAARSPEARRARLEYLARTSPNVIEIFEAAARREITPEEAADIMMRAEREAPVRLVLLAILVVLVVFFALYTTTLVT
jgi:hypothetical protein